MSLQSGKIYLTYMNIFTGFVNQRNLPLNTVTNIYSAATDTMSDLCPELGFTSTRESSKLSARSPDAFHH